MDFLTSLAVICLSALMLGSICSKIKLPPLLGMLIIGIVLGPYVLDLIAPSILGISADLRKLALIIILTRAGLNLNLKDLKKRRFGSTSVFYSRNGRNFRIFASRHFDTQTFCPGCGDIGLRYGCRFACSCGAAYA